MLTEHLLTGSARQEMEDADGSESFCQGDGWRGLHFTLPTYL